MHIKPNYYVKHNHLRCGATGDDDTAPEMNVPSIKTKFIVAHSESATFGTMQIVICSRFAAVARRESAYRTPHTHTHINELWFVDFYSN